MVVDANVWISRAQGTEIHSPVSRRWLLRQERAGVRIVVPNLALAEVAGGIARITNNPGEGLRVVHTVLLAFAGIQVVSMNEALGRRAMELAAQLRLRGADAVYVALAETNRLPLVTWDEEVLVRAAAAVPVLRPS